MKSNQTIVEFSVKGVEIRGEVVRTDDARRKIVFLAGYKPETVSSWRGTLPENGQMWIVDVVHDTKPSESFRGALMVRLVRQVRWALMPVGEAVDGQREMRPVCLDEEGISPISCQSISRQEIETANAPWREAQTRLRKEQEVAQAVESTWQHGQAEGFFKTFGRPSAVTPLENGTVVLSYPRGEKVVPSWGILGWLKQISQPEATSWAWNEADKTAEVLFTFADLGVATTAEVCRLVNIVKGSLPPMWDQVSPEMKAEIISFLWDKNLLNSEQWGRTMWSRRWSDDYLQSTLRREVTIPMVALAHQGRCYLTVETYSESQEVTGHYGSETWGTGSYTSVKVSNQVLVVGGYECRIRGSLFLGQAGLYNMVCPKTNRVEEARQWVLERAVAFFAKNVLLSKADCAPAREMFSDDEAWKAWQVDCRRAYDVARRESLSAWWAEVQSLIQVDREAWELYRRMTEVAGGIEKLPLSCPRPSGQELAELREVSLFVEQREKHSREMQPSRDRFQVIRTTRSMWYDLSTELRDKLEERLHANATIPSTVEEMVVWHTETEALFAEVEVFLEELRRQREAEASARAEAAQAKAKAREEAAIRETQAFVPHQAGVEESTEINPRIVAFAEAVREIVGVRLGIEILRGELYAPYGRARRQDGIRAGVPGIDQTRVGSTFLGFSRATDVDTWLFEAISSLEKSTSVSSKASDSDQKVEVGKLDLSGLFGGSARVKK